MKKTQFKIGLLTACLVGLSSVASAQSCGVDSCDSKSCKCTQKHCDDNGLLEVINTAASNFEARLASIIPDRNRPHAKAKHCDSVQRDLPSDFAMQYTEIAPRPASQQPLSNKLHTAPHGAHPEALRPPVPRPATPYNRAVAPDPAPYSPSHEIVPLPDAGNDPFKDDPTTRRLRGVPARPASHSRSNSVRPLYDPQATNHKSRRSELMSQAVSKSISDSAHPLTSTKSTRRAQPIVDNERAEGENETLEQESQEVVPASISIPVSGLRSPTATPPEAAELINPLRSK